MAEKVQNTITAKWGDKEIVSKPFDFEAFCLVDDMRYDISATGGLIGKAHLGKKALNYLFRGTELTDERIEALSFVERRELCEAVADLYFASFPGKKSKNA